MTAPLPLRGVCSFLQWNLLISGNFGTLWSFMLFWDTGLVSVLPWKNTEDCNVVNSFVKEKTSPVLASRYHLLRELNVIAHMSISCLSTHDRHSAMLSVSLIYVFKICLILDLFGFQWRFAPSSLIWGHWAHPLQYPGWSSQTRGTNSINGQALTQFL